MSAWMIVLPDYLLQYMKYYNLLISSSFFPWAEQSRHYKCTLVLSLNTSEATDK